jgi:hypothetical protein
MSARIRERAKSSLSRSMSSRGEVVSTTARKDLNCMAVLIVSGVNPVSLDGSIDSSNALQLKYGSSSLDDYEQTLHAKHSVLNSPPTGTIRIKLVDFSHGGATWQINAEHTSGVNTINWTRASDHAYYDFDAMATALEVSAESNASPPQTKRRRFWLKTMPTDGQ